MKRFLISIFVICMTLHCFSQDIIYDGMSDNIHIVMLSTIIYDIDEYEYNIFMEAATDKSVKPSARKVNYNIVIYTINDSVSMMSEMLIKLNGKNKETCNILLTPVSMHSKKSDGKIYYFVRYALSDDNYAKIEQMKITKIRIVKNEYVFRDKKISCNGLGKFLIKSHKILETKLKPRNIYEGF